MNHDYSIPVHPRGSLDAAMLSPQTYGAGKKFFCVGGATGAVIGSTT